MYVTPSLKTTPKLTPRAEGNGGAATDESARDLGGASVRGEEGEAQGDATTQGADVEDRFNKVFTKELAPSLASYENALDLIAQFFRD